MAYHEAGHAVIALVGGLRVGLVCIETEAANPYPFCDTTYPCTTDEMIAVLHMGLAGGLAHAKLEGRKWSGYCYNADDIYQFKAILRTYAAMTGQSARALEPLLYHQAEMLVSKHWDDISAVAGQLMEHGTVRLHDKEFRETR